MNFTSIKSEQNYTNTLQMKVINITPGDNPKPVKFSFIVSVYLVSGDLYHIANKINRKWWKIISLVDMSHSVL